MAALMFSRNGYDQRTSRDASMAYEKDLIDLAIGMLRPDEKPNTVPYSMYVLEGEESSSYYIEFPLAGYKKEDLTITCNGGYLVVSGKAQEYKDRKYTSVIKHIAPSFHSRIRVYDSKVNSARYENGVLTINMHKPKPPQASSIPIL